MIMNFMQLIDIHLETWVRVSTFIPDVLDNYYVSDHGRVKKGERVMKGNTSDGHERVRLSHKKSNGKKYYVHRLVALAFIPNDDPINKTHVNHLAGNLKAWNHIENLEWETPKGNSVHSVETGLSPTGENHYRSKYTDDFIRAICMMLEKGMSSKDIIKELGFVRENFREYENIRKLIAHIRLRDSWKSISKDYKF